MGATFPRIKTWVDDEDVEYTDINAEFDNILNNLTPTGVDDHSVNTTQMRLQTNPGSYGSESLATSLAGEIQRLRFKISQIIGGDNSVWYDTPEASIASLVTSLGNTLAPNRIISGRVRTSSDQPMFLLPHGTNRTVTLDATTPDFVYSVDSTEYTLSADITATSLTAAPSANNTCLVNDAVAAAQEYTKFLGENGTQITIDNVGSELTALIGKYVGFKINNGTDDEYFIGLMGTNKITNCYRGFFYSSAGTPWNRIVFTDNDVITLMKLTWVFVKSDGTLGVTYTNPTYSFTEPSSPALGDYWFDLANDTWKSYNGTTFVSASATLCGICLQNTTATIAARAFDFSKSFISTNTIETVFSSTTQVVSRKLSGQVGVYGSLIDLQKGSLLWDITTDLESGFTEAASTKYYLYVSTDGDTYMSPVAPHERLGDLQGYYHPHQSWRAVGWAYNNGSSNITQVESFFKYAPNTVVIEESKTAAAVISRIHNQVIPVDTSGGAFTQYVPHAAYWKGRRITFVKTTSDFTAFTISSLNSETFIGGASASATSVKIHTQGERVTLESDGTNIYVVDRFIPTILGAQTALTIIGSVSNPTKATTREVDRCFAYRYGQILQLFYEYRADSATGGVNGSGTYEWLIPGSLTADTAVITASTVQNNHPSCIGVATAGSGAGAGNSDGHVILYDSTHVALVTGEEGNNWQFVGSAWYPLTTANLCIAFECRIPISGWEG